MPELSPAMVFLSGGAGILAVVVPFGALVGMELLADSLGGSGTYASRPYFYAGLALLPAGYSVFLIGRRLNGGPARDRHLQPALTVTAEETVPFAAPRRPLRERIRRLQRRSVSRPYRRGVHTLFFIRMERWGVVLSLLGLGLLLSEAV